MLPDNYVSCVGFLPTFWKIKRDITMSKIEQMFDYEGKTKKVIGDTKAQA